MEADGHGTQERVPLDSAERLEEMLMMGLRLAEGVPLARIRAETGKDLPETVDPDALRDLAEGGFLSLDAGRLRATEAGRQRLNAVLGALLG